MECATHCVQAAFSKRPAWSNDISGWDTTM